MNTKRDESPTYHMTVCGARSTCRVVINEASRHQRCIKMDISLLLANTCSAIPHSSPLPPSTGPENIPLSASLSQPSSQYPPLPPPGQCPSHSSLKTPLASVSSLDAPNLKPAFVDTGGATSFAGRNPLKDIQPARARVRNSKSGAVKLGQAAKIAARSQKANYLKIGVDAIVRSQDRDVKELSEQLDVSERSIKKLVNGQTHYKKHREPNMFNALVHKVTEEMNTGNIHSIYFV